MAISTLLLGVGGTGVLAVRAAKKLYSELDDESKVSASFLAIDFDRSALEQDGDELCKLDPGEFLYLDPEGIQVPVRNIDRLYESRPVWETVRSWFPDPAKAPIPTSEVEANGAGQFRVLGRLGFFIYDSLIEKALLRAYESLEIEVDTVSTSRERRVILIASIAGGTGSGMMIDLAYVVRNHLEGRPNVFAYLLLPEVFAEVDFGGRIYQNAYAALRELAHLKDQVIPFKADYFSIAPLDVPVGSEQPFSRIFLYGRAKTDGQGASPVLAATLQMAAAIQPQLNRKLQMKSLAIAANTASESSEARSRLQMQCFSTSGSQVVPLGGGAQSIDSKQLFHAALSLLTEDGLGELYSAEASDRIDRVTESEDADNSTAPPPRLGRDPATEVTIIGDRLKELAGQHAGSLASQVLERVKSLTETDWDSSHESSPIIEASERLRELAMGRDDGFSYANLDDLDIDQLEDFRADLLEWTSRFVPETSPPRDPRNLLEQWAYLSKLEHLLRELSIESPEVNTLELDEARRLFEEIERRERGPDIRRWRRLVSRHRIRQNFALATLAAIRNLDTKLITQRLDVVLRQGAREELLQRVQLAKDNHKKELERSIDQVRTLQRSNDVQSSRHDLIHAQVRDQLTARLREVAPKFLRELRRLGTNDGEAPEVLRNRIFHAFRTIVLADSELSRLRFEEDLAVLEAPILEGLVGMRQSIFVRRSPNPRRVGIAVASCPSGFRNGTEEIENFLEVNTEQLLLCRCQVIRNEEPRVWIYYEDLFNPPDHLRNIENYYNAYRSQAHPELFHIDRRFLELDSFRHIIAGTTRRFLCCGNADCDYNLVGTMSEHRVCDGCGQWIRSRCGNPGCREDSLHTHEKRFATMCPSCGGFNHSAWWRCNRHGKDEELVPVDKRHCPRCIETHHDDPLGFPLSCVSKRPDLLESVRCPRCVDLQREDPNHPIFEVRGELFRFYRDGVNGHDLAKFARLATSTGLADGFRCPHCRTTLIPVHHRAWAKESCP